MFLLSVTEREAKDLTLEGVKSAAFVGRRVDVGLERSCYFLSIISRMSAVSLMKLMVDTPLWKLRETPAALYYCCLKIGEPPGGCRGQHDDFTVGYCGP